MGSRKNHSTNNLSEFKENKEEQSNYKKTPAIEMRCSDSNPLEKTIVELITLQGEQHKLSLKKQKNESLPLIQDYINSAKTIRDLIDIYHHLNWNTEFNYLKTRRHQKFDAMFKSKSGKSESSNDPVEASATWKKISAFILEKLSLLIQADNTDLASDQVRNKCLTLFMSLKEILNKDGERELLGLQEQFFNVINEDQYFLDIFSKYKSHSFSKLNSIIALQNIYYFVEDNNQSNDPLLDPLRYILAISYDQKLKERGEKIDKLIYSNSYMQIGICIRAAKNIDELKKILRYLQKDEFNLVKDKSRWNKVKTDIQRQASVLGAEKEIDVVFEEIAKPVVTPVPSVTNK